MHVIDKLILKGKVDIGGEPILAWGRLFIEPVKRILDGTSSLESGLKRSLAEDSKLSGILRDLRYASHCASVVGEGVVTPVQCSLRALAMSLGTERV